MPTIIFSTTSWLGKFQFQFHFSVFTSLLFLKKPYLPSPFFFRTLWCPPNEGGKKKMGFVGRLGMAIGRNNKNTAGGEDKAKLRGKMLVVDIVTTDVDDLSKFTSSLLLPCSPHRCCFLLFLLFFSLSFFWC
jgi:hypothetical protein